LNGLGPSFKEFVTSIRTDDTPIKFHELYDKFVDYKIFMKRDDRLQSYALVTTMLSITILVTKVVVQSLQNHPIISWIFFLLGNRGVYGLAKPIT